MELLLLALKLIILLLEADPVELTVLLEYEPLLKHPDTVHDVDSLSPVLYTVPVISGSDAERVVPIELLLVVPSRNLPLRLGRVNVVLPFPVPNLVPIALYRSA